LGKGILPSTPPPPKHISLFKVKNEYAFFMYLIKNEGKCPHFGKFRTTLEAKSNVKIQ